MLTILAVIFENVMVSRASQENQESNSTNEIRKDDQDTKIFSILREEGTKIHVNLHSGSGETFLLLETNLSRIYGDLTKSISGSIKKYKDATFLHQLCCDDRNILLVKSLLETGIVDVNVVDNNQKTALHVAVIENCVEIVKLLLAHPKIKLDLCDHSGKTPLHYAHSNVTLLKILLNHNQINVMKQDSDGKTIMHHYYSRAQPVDEIVKLIKKKAGGYDIFSIKDNKGYRPADHAHAKQREDALDGPIQPLLKAIETGSVTNVKSVMEKHFPSEVSLSSCEYRDHVKDVFYGTLSRLKRNNKEKNLEIVRSLLNHFPDLCLERNVHGKTPLHIVCEKNLHGVVEILLNNPNINLYEKCNRGKLPIHYAIRKRSMRAFYLLLNKMDITRPDDEDGKTILHHCFEHGKDKKMAMFTALSKRDEYNVQCILVKDKRKKFPLHYVKKQKDWQFLYDFGKSLFGEALSIKHLMLSQIKKLATKLDFHDTSQPPWERLCEKLKEDHDFITNLQMQCFSKDCNYKLGKNIVGVMKTHRMKVTELIYIARRKKHMEITQLLENYSNLCVSDLDHTVLNNLAIYIGMVRQGISEQIRFGIYENLKLCEETIDTIKNNSSDPQCSPTTQMFRQLRMAKPTFEIKYLWKALKDLKLNDVVNVLGEITFEIIVKRMVNDVEQ